MIDNVFFAIEIIGVIAFAISGALVAIHRENDWFGVLFLALITTFGGGIMRDLIIGVTPPRFFTSMPIHVTVCAATALAVFIFAAVFKSAYVRNEQTVKKINNYFDAVGIAVFSVVSVRIVIDECGPDNAFLAITMGMISAIGGGILRDLILRDIPFVLRKHVYAVAALAGAVLYYVLSVHLIGGSELGELIAKISGVILVFVIRVLATVFKWNMPKAIIFSKMRQQTQKAEEDKLHS